MAENVVSRGRVEKEVRQRERHQEGRLNLVGRESAVRMDFHSFAFAFLDSSPAPSALVLRRLFRLVTADTVRFNFRAIKALSKLNASSVRRCASSAGVHSRPWGSGPFLIAFAFSRVIDS
jgi:hypothetical protein